MKGGGGGRKVSLRRMAPVVGVLCVSADNARLANRAIAIPKPLAIARVGVRRVSGSKCTMSVNLNGARNVRGPVNALRR